jgi:hypothetical protein
VTNLELTKDDTVVGKELERVTGFGIERGRRFNPGARIWHASYNISRNGRAEKGPFSHLMSIRGCMDKLYEQIEIPFSSHFIANTPPP